MNKDLLPNSIKQFDERLALLHKKLIAEGVKYGDNAVPSAPIPLLFSAKEWDIINKTLNPLGKIITKAIKAIYSDKNLFDRMTFNKLEKELIRNQNDFQNGCPLFRLDLGKSKNGDYKIFEINTLFSGLAPSDFINQCSYSILENEGFDEGLKRIKWLPVIPTFAKFIKNKYLPEGETLALIGKTDNPIISEYLYTIKALKEAGISKVICAPVNEIKFNNVGSLIINDEQVGTIYLRGTFSDWGQFAHIRKGVIKAISNGKLKIVPPFTSLIADSKALLAIFHLPEFQNNLTVKERQFVRKNIPFTQFLDSIRASETDISNLINNNEKYVIKNFDGYGGKDVYIGKNYNKSEWSKLINSLDADRFVVQEYIQDWTINFLFKDTVRKRQKFYVNLNIIYLDNSIIGGFGRGSFIPKINIASGAYLLPLFIETQDKTN